MDIINITILFNMTFFFIYYILRKAYKDHNKEKEKRSLISQQENII